MARTPPVEAPKQSHLALQILLGAVSVAGVLLGTAVVTAIWDNPLVAAPAVTAWMIASLVGVALLERRKIAARTAPGPDAWAEQVRELRSSRLEIVNAFEIERERVERDLHDGAQQYLVAASMKVGEAVLLLTREDDDRRVCPEVISLLTSAQDCAEDALAALRETVSGIHPTVLTDLGLASAVRELVGRSPVSVVLRTPHPLPPLPEGVAAAAYFLVSEALVNIAKHAPSAGATVLLSADQQLHISVVDDGPGGASFQTGHGLVGMSERLAAFGGSLALASPAGGPTSVTARIPLLLDAGVPAAALESPAVGQGRR